MLGPEGDVDHLTVSADGILAMTAASGYSIRVWDLRDRLEIARFTDHLDSIEDVRFMPGGRAVVSGSRDKTVQVWLLPPDEDQLVAEICHALPQDEQQFRADELRKWPELRGLAAPCAKTELGIVRRIVSNILHTTGIF